MTTKALVQPPAASFASGLTKAGLGPPDAALAAEQHEGYVAALERAGVEVLRLPSDDRFPDGTFVEDAAIVTPRGAVLARPGAPSRLGEVPAVAEALGRVLPTLGRIEAPGTLDGGDVCATETRVFIGITDRTNEEGARQLAALLGLAGRRSVLVDLRGTPGLLHLKTGVAYLGEGRLLAWESLARREELRGLEILPVPMEEAYAANAVEINGRVLLADGFPETRDRIERAGLRTVAVPVSEFRKMDGGLSCLSIRW